MAASERAAPPIPLSTLLQEGRERLGTDADSQIDLRVLTAALTGLDRARQLIDPDQTISEPIATQLRHAISRRVQGEPIAYILGRRGFWRYEFLVTPHTLIPRPETELLVDWALTHLVEGQPYALADLGTGSGVIAICLAAERPDVTVYATDVSPGALEVARQNHQRIAPQRHIHWIESSWASAFEPHSLDLVVSNPPYIRIGDPHLDTGDLRFEPASALVAGVDGLDDYRLLITQVFRVLKPGGWLLMEHGYDQSAALQAMMATCGFAQLETRLDLAGQPRATGGQKPAG